MQQLNETTLEHVKLPYDPVKAHEYYIRRRKLKGRKKSTSYTVKYGSGKTVKLTSRQLIEQKAYASKRVGEIKKKLTELSSKLQEAMREAEKKKSTSKRESAKPPSTADKSKAARDSQQYRDKHKQKIATATKKTTSTVKKSNSTDPVEQLVHRIDTIRGSLKVAVARQRSLAGATRNG